MVADVTARTAELAGAVVVVAGFAVVAGAAVAVVAGAGAGSRWWPGPWSRSGPALAGAVVGVADVAGGWPGP